MLKSVTAIEASLYCIVYFREDTGQILLTRLYEHLDQAEILPDSQCGFRKDRIPIYHMTVMLFSEITHFIKII